jgi:L-lactate dehydrogenase (cytochrome)
MAQKVSAAEVAKHNLEGDVWVTVNGKVYDMADFAPTHPGGSEGMSDESFVAWYQTLTWLWPPPLVIYRHGGKDASQEYNKAHSPTLIEKSLGERHRIGSLDKATITEAWGQAGCAPSPRTARVDPQGRPGLDHIINLDDFERAAHLALPEKPWAFVNGGSNDNITRDANNAMLRRIWLRPAVMRDVGTVNTNTKLFGCKLDLPIYISPTGAARMSGPEGEIALAQGAAASGIIHCIATPPHDKILQATPQHAFFQLYVNKERQKSEVAIRQAMASRKVKALFVTVDVPVISKREADSGSGLPAPQMVVSCVGYRRSSTQLSPGVTWHGCGQLRTRRSW